MTQRQLLTALLKFLGAICVLHGGLWLLTIILTLHVSHSGGIVAVAPLIELLVGFALWAKFKLDDETP